METINPLQRITYQYNIKVIQAGINPFIGGYYDEEMYILLVYNTNESRNYGVPYSLSNISGDVKIFGNLTSQKNINLINLKIDGDLIIDIGQGKYNISGGAYNNLIVYESKLSKIHNDELGIDSLDVVRFPKLQNNNEIQASNELANDVANIPENNKIEKYINRIKKVIKTFK